MDAPQILLFCRKPCFQMKKKLETCRNLLTNVRRSFFGDEINVTITNFTNSMQHYVYFYLKEFHIWHRHLTVQVKHNYTFPKLFVCCISLEANA